MAILLNVLMGLLALSFVASGVLVLVRGSFPWSVLVWVLGTGLGAVLVVLSGTFWVQLLLPDTFESQGGGIAFLVAYLPFFVISGLFVGAWSVAWGYFLAPSPANLWWFQGVGLLGSAVLGGLLPGAMAALLSKMLQPLAVYDPESNLNLIILALAVLVGSSLTALVAHGTTRLVMRVML